ncbi:MAG: metallophosphoesterase [Gammaproteobacteria bacterium]|nr:metallophosphoesterase [Gammaproteobacteria bacterium]
MKANHLVPLAHLILGLLALVSHAQAETATDPQLKVAFIGDQGSNLNSEAVLQLIRDEAENTGIPVSMVLHQGDFDYNDDPVAWDALINRILGIDFPYFASVGNHDTDRWDGIDGYKAILEQRLARIQDQNCTGVLGVNSACTYKGLFFILSGVGTLGTGHAQYLTNELAASDAIWELCTWHRNQNSMQVGDKPDDVGWSAYEECRKAGAIVATGHEHSYSRTRTLTSMENLTVDPSCSEVGQLCVESGDNGTTFAFVSGLAGITIRNQDRCLPTTFPYGCNDAWANIYTSDQAATHGALFITFNVDDNPNKARGYFKNINNEIVDDFEIVKISAIVPRAPVLSID